MAKAKLATLKSSLKTLGNRLSLLPVSGRIEQRGQGLYTYRWKQASKGFLREHPLCQCPECDEGRKRVRVATVTDHQIPHRGDLRLFWDRTNWKAMAKECHDAKTAGEDGGFGNAPKR
ncbi:MAG: HNH endonuclease [Betaproteobacteria bacterium]|nr:HNH endonuclease [Betaproteobacteria bacterium]